MSGLIESIALSQETCHIVLLINRTVFQQRSNPVTINSKLATRPNIPTSMYASIVASHNKPAKGQKGSDAGGVGSVRVLHCMQWHIY